MIIAKNLHKMFGQGHTSTHALKGINLEVNTGEFIAVMGRSGSGKSTLLHMLGLLDKPTSGEIYIDDENALKLSEEQKVSFRLGKIGYVFQDYSLITEMNILENVFLPSLCLGLERNYRQRAKEILELVGLGHRLTHFPNEVSGGEQQRVAIARALINKPSILFADEPTANLDASSAETILELFERLNRELKQTIIMVTHEPEDKKYVNRVVWLKDGFIVENG